MPSLEACVPGIWRHRYLNKVNGHMSINISQHHSISSDVYPMLCDDL
jgi:hypothetical protein